MKAALRVAPLRVALVGAGVMGARHARVIAESPRTTLARVIDPDPAADRFGCDWTPELDLSGVDAVIVAAPNPLHEQIAADVLEVGLPVLVEKPLAADLDAATRTVELAAKLDVPIMCGFVDRFNPAWLALRSVLGGRTPVHLTIVRHSPFQTRVLESVAWDLLIHLADHAIALYGGADPDAVWARRTTHASPVSDDTADALATWGSGTGILSAVRLGQRRMWTVTAHAPGVTVFADLVGRQVTVSTGGATEYAPVGDREPLAAQLDHFAGLAQGYGDAEAERESILPAHRLIDRVMK